MFLHKKTRVSCPKCRSVHEINSENICPVCGTKYKLPKDFDKKNRGFAALSLKSITESISAFVSTKAKVLADRFSNLRNSTKRLVKLSFALAVFFAVFILIVFACFSDKEPLDYKVGKVENQPAFHYTTDDRLCCLFPNGKNTEIGIGILRQYASSNNGKSVYLVFSGKPSGDPGSSKMEASNYIICVEDFEKIRYIYDNPYSVPQILCGGNNEYLYVLNNLGVDTSFCELALIRKNGKPLSVARDVKEAAISPNGHYAFYSVNDNGASKLFIYNAGNEKSINAGIKNATPLSVDNKGEYLVYARKNNEESLSIISEKSTSERLEIPVIPEAQLMEVVFSRDKRSFAIRYDDRTTFYSCGDDYYSTVLTSPGSRFGTNIAENTLQNIHSFTDIPAVSVSSDSSLLPYYFYDKEREGIYCVEADSSKLPVFDRTFTSVVVSESGNAAFVSDGKLYSGKLSAKNNELCEMMVFDNKKLVDISPDGKKILYSDFDGNLFIVNYGEKDNKPVKIYVDADFVKFSENSDVLLVCGDNVTSFITGSKVSNLCEGIIPEESIIVKKDLSSIIFAKEIYRDGAPTGEKCLCLYSSGKTRIISEKLKKLIAPDSSRIDRNLSDYTDIFSLTDER